MKLAQFNAYCPFEIGDRVQDTSGRVHEITDIAAIHYVRTGKVEFRFELDHSGGPYLCIEHAERAPRQKETYSKSMVMFVGDECGTLPPDFKAFIRKRFG